MALFKSTKPAGRTLADFPRLEDEKHKALWEQLREAEAAHEESVQARIAAGGNAESQTQREAVALLEGTATEVGPSEAELRRRAQTLREAIKIQEQRAEKERLSIASQIGEDFVDE